MKSPFGATDAQHGDGRHEEPTARLRRFQSAAPPRTLSIAAATLFAPLDRAATITSPLYLHDVAEYEARRDKHSRFYHDLARTRSVHLRNRQQEEYEAWWLGARRRTSVVINIANVLERMDEQVLPAVYKFIGASYGATPSQLGYLTMCRAMTQAAAAPLGGIAGHQYNRLAVICTGCTLWGIGITGLAFTQTLLQGMRVVALDGVGLSLLIPNVQSLTADYHDELHRGRAFGVLFMTGALGGALGALYATNVAGLSPWGVEGWRVVFVSIGVVSVVVGVVAYKLGHDPRYENDDSVNLDKTATSGGTLCAEVSSILVIPTFLIIILQGIVGSMPWNSLVFLTLYFQLLGMSNLTASILMSTFLLSTAVGGVLGGWVGDQAARRFPNHGRIAATQFSIALGIPLSVVLLKMLPQAATTVAALLHGAVLVSMGVLITWSAPCCNNPVFAEIVPPHLRNLVYAFDRSFEMGISALGAPLVGVLAERWFGWDASSQEEAAGADLKNARALGNALLLCMVLPWFLSFVCYSGLHLTYPRDKEYSLAMLADDDASEGDGYEALPAALADEQQAPRVRLADR